MIRIVNDAQRKPTANKGGIEVAKAKHHSVRSNAVRAARDWLGKDAKQGEEFSILTNQDGTFSWLPLGKPLSPQTVSEARAATSPDEPNINPSDDEVPAFLKKGRKAAAVAKVAPEQPKPEPKAAKAPKAPRENTKGATVLAMIQRKGGATAAELIKATEWEPHTLRGFISTANRKHSLGIKATRKDGVTTYTT